MELVFIVYEGEPVDCYIKNVAILLLQIPYYSLILDLDLYTYLQCSLLFMHLLQK